MSAEPGITIDTRYVITAATVVDSQLHIDWGDGHHSEFHPLWLRHQCYCPDCGTPLNGVRGLRLHHLPDELEPRLESFDADDVELTWLHDGHRSHYAAEWLRDHCYSPDERARRKHHPIRWDAGIMDNCPSADLLECERSAEARLALLENVRDYGFAFVRNVPGSIDEASRLIEIIGAQRHTHYGNYTLGQKKSVDNVGDTTTALDPHTDETYRTSTVGITVFQVIRPASVGGHSTLVDGFEAVRRLRESAPDEFELLTRLPITGARLDPAANSGGNSKWYSATMPMIRIDFDGEVCGVRMNERQIMPLDVPAELIDPAYRAIRHLFEILYDPDLCLTFPLKCGEGLIFDNQRVLHGRTAYEAETPPRSVLTTSVDIEDFHSSLRLLTESLRGKVSPNRLPQGMVG